MDTNKAGVTCFLSFVYLIIAYGINLIAANYIFLMDPVWDLSKESQAIKRAHRLHI